MFCWCEWGISLVPQGFDVGALIPQGLAGSPNYFGFLNYLVTLITIIHYCEDRFRIHAS